MPWYERGFFRCEVSKRAGLHFNEDKSLFLLSNEIELKADMPKVLSENRPALVNEETLYQLFAGITEYTHVFKPADLV